MNKPVRRIRAGVQKSNVYDIETRRALDAFTNQLARIGWGTDNLLEYTNYPLTRLTRNYILMQSLYRSNWIARKVVDCIADDMMKNWIEFSTDLDPERIDDLDKVITKTAVEAKLLEAIKWARLFGGAGAVMIVKGHEDILDEPLELDDVEPDSFRGLLVFDRWSGITPGADIVTDIDNPEEFGLPAYYQVSTEAAQTFNVHASRVLRFTNRSLPQWEWQAEQRWGISEYEIVFDELKKRDNTSWNLASLIFRANIFAIKQKDLNQMLSGINASAEVQKRFYQILSAQTQLMSNQGVMVLPEDGGMETHSYAFGGINDVYESFMLDICGATEIPMSRLFGRTITGLSGSNEGDEHTYYDMIGQKQQRELQPQLRKLLPVIAMSVLGEVPDDFDWLYKPVRTMSNEEKAELAAKETTAVVEAFNAGIIPQKTAMQELKTVGEETNLFTNITDEMIDEADDTVQMPMGEMGMGGAEGGGPAGGPPDASGEGEIPATPNSKPKKGTTDALLIQPLKKSEVQFERKASGDDLCKLCRYFEAPRDCEIVAGGVTPSSWCNRFERGSIPNERYGGLAVHVENDVGTVRKGVGLSGEKWEVMMTYPYGYIKRTEGTDGDAVDCFLGPHPESKKAFIIHTQNPITLEYDEDKVMLGWRTAGEAREAMEENYDDLPHVQSIETLSLGELKTKLKSLRGRKITTYDAGFTESDHPRKADGKFAPKGQGESGGAGEELKAQFEKGNEPGANRAYNQEEEQMLTKMYMEAVEKGQHKLANHLKLLNHANISKKAELLKAQQEKLIAEKEAEGNAEEGIGKLSAIHSPKEGEQLKAQYEAAIKAGQPNMAEVYKNVYQGKVVPSELLNKANQEIKGQAPSNAVAEKSKPKPFAPKEGGPPTKSGKTLKEITAIGAQHKDKIIAEYKNGMSIGKISTGVMGLEADNYTHYVIRNILKKEGIYKSPLKKSKWGGAAPAPAGQPAPITSQPSTALQATAAKFQATAKQFVDQVKNVKGGYSGSSDVHGQQVVKNYMAKLGITNGVQASKAIQNWTGSSWSSGAMAWKAVAIKYYGKSHAEEPKKAMYAYNDSTLKEAASIEQGILATKALAKEYVAKYGAKKVYRGVSGEIAAQIKAQIKSGAKHIEFKQNALTSWSANKSTAQNFGSSGVMLEMDVDPEHVWGSYDATPWAFGAHFGESEYVMGSPGKTFKLPVSQVKFL